MKFYLSITCALLIFGQYSKTIAQEYSAQEKNSNQKIVTGDSEEEVIFDDEEEALSGQSTPVEIPELESNPLLIGLPILVLVLFITNVRWKKNKMQRDDHEID
jgi:hypothetical protein